MHVADFDRRDLVRLEVIDTEDVTLRRVGEREPELVRPARRDREDVLGHADHERRQRLPGPGLKSRDVVVVLVADEEGPAVGRPHDPVRLFSDHQAGDLFHRERIDDRSRVSHPVVHRDPFAVRRHSELMRELAHGDLSHERVRLAGFAVEHPDLIGAFRRDEDPELRIKRCRRRRWDRRRRRRRRRGGLGA